MTTTRVQFAQGLLKQLGVQPTNRAVNNLVSWMQAEGGNAEFNPLNTTLNLGLSGETNYNSFDNGKYHVQNYPTLQAGELAEAKTLKYHPEIISALNSSPAVFDTTVDNSGWGTSGLTPSVRPINKTVADKPGGLVTPVGTVGDGTSNSFKSIEWWNPFSWGNAATDAENLIFRVIAGGIGLFLIIWGVKMLLDSKGTSITNVFGGSPNTSSQKNSTTSNSATSEVEKTAEKAGSDVEELGEAALA
jgi:hypothetical protein